MIKISNLKKVYPSNKLVSINNTTLTLPDTGLITLLGQSGSGKTTLLNVIGGLDNFNSGTIEYDDFKLNKYDMKKIDLFRNNNVSYIFQNYYLVDDLTVYENLKLALEINDIYDPTEQEKRIKEALNAVSLYKFRKKKVDALSGGQQQRVAIARALTKRNKLIIADEPTGNLDSKNSILVMNILKKVSETSLVLLVTHNDQLANYYSDKIYRISDGKIINEYVPSSNSLDLSDNTIYLKDLNSKNLNSENDEITLYNYPDEKLELKLVYINDTYYISSNQSIKLLKDSNISIVDKHKAEIEKEEIIKTEYSAANFENIYNHKKFRKFMLHLKDSFVNYNNTKKKVKFMRFGLFLIGMGFAYLFANLLNNLQINTATILQARNSYIVDVDNKYNNSYKNEISLSDIVEAYDNNKISYLNLQGSANGQLYSSKLIDYKTEYYVYQKCFLNGEKILYGEITDSSNTIVITKGLAQQLIADSKTEVNLNTLVGKTFETSRTSSVDSSYDYYSIKSSYTIEAIIDSDSRCGYVPSYSNESTIQNKWGLNNYFMVPYFNYGLFYNVTYYKNKSVLDNVIKSYGNKSDPSVCNTEYADFDYYVKYGREPENEKEVMLNICYNPEEDNSKYTYDAEVLTNYLTSLGFEIVGYFYDSPETKLMFYEGGEDRFFELFPYYSGKYEFVVNDRSLLKYDNIINYYDTEKAIISRNTIESNKANILIMAVLIVALVLYIYFTEKSRMFSDIKRIGILRAIGQSKHDIAITYACQSFVETLFTVVIGFILSSVIYGLVANATNKVNSVISIQFYQLPYFYIALICLVLVFTFFGALPSIFLMKKTPSEIIAKYDI